ncbi:MAG: enoyl-CoA hydratase/isomerase family protein [Balneolaceae bacterium]
MSLTVKRTKHIITATVNRPEARNAVNFDLMERLEKLLDELEADKEVRLFVLTGSGDSFISGGDLREFHQLKKADEAKQMTSRMIEILDRIENLPCWTLAAVNGYAYGGGWETLLVFDFRVAKQSAKIGFTQGKFYLPPGWGGISRLTKTVGRDAALYWLASQKVIRADEALRSGLIQDIFKDESYQKDVDALSERLVLNDRAFIEYVKSSQSHNDIADEIEPFSRFWESDEHLKRVDAFLSRK